MALALPLATSLKASQLLAWISACVWSLSLNGSLFKTSLWIMVAGIAEIRQRRSMALSSLPRVIFLYKAERIGILTGALKRSRMDFIRSFKRSMSVTMMFRADLRTTSPAMAMNFLIASTGVSCWNLSTISSLSCCTAPLTYWASFSTSFSRSCHASIMSSPTVVGCS